MNPYICDIIYGFIIENGEECSIQYVLENKFNINLNEMDNANGFYINNLFVRLCAFGYLSVAQWLDHINGSKYQNEHNHAFKWCCMRGQFNVAQWLYSLGNVNIHEMGDHAFRTCCSNGHLHIAQWLYSLGD